MTDPDEVVRLRDRTIDGLLAARATIPPTLVFARERVEDNIRGTQARARARIAELQPDHPALAQPDRIPESGPMPDSTGSLFSQNGKPWHPVDNPVRVAWLPEFGNRWLNKKIARAQDNIPRLQKDPELFKNAMMGAVPSALFVLVPVFALLLKLFYVFKRRLYMEHVIVVLHSQAFLFLWLLLLTLLGEAVAWLKPHAAWAARPAGWLETIVLLWGPVWLLLAQKRIYRQGWPMTVLKYCCIGWCYFWLLLTVLVVAAVLGAAH